MDKKYAEELAAKRRIFLEKTNTKKAVFMTLLTTLGAATNEHYLNTVQNQLTMSALFESL